MTTQQQIDILERQKKGSETMEEIERINEELEDLRKEL